MGELGLVHVYFGAGKGKTTAAMGLAARALGAGKRVLLTQFLKQNDTSERTILSAIPACRWVDSRLDTTKFTWQMTREERLALGDRLALQAEQAFSEARDHKADMLVLDEALGALHEGLLDEACLLARLKARPPAMEVVLTGRDPSPALLACADYQIEMVCHRHPFAHGIAARCGIEW